MTEGSDTYKLWRDTPVPQVMNFYLHNWTNPEELGKEKPVLTQMGPYSFKVTERKTKVTWNENGTVTYKIERYWFYDSENSQGSLEDEITTLNSVAMSAANAVRYKDLFLKKGLSTSLWATQQKIFVRKTVGELLFFGYSDPLLQMAAQLPAFSDIEIPPYDKFAWFYLRNGSDSFEGTFEMDRGVNDIFSFGMLRHWNYNDRTKFYPPPCGLIKGSAGEMFPPEQKKTNKVEMFSADLCRSIALSFSEEVEIRGVKGYKYSGDVYTFDNGTLDPTNKCFCGGECSPSGVLNVTACRFGAPGFVSFPHFYLGDQFYRNQVSGMQPNHDAHEMYITLEPNTGIPLDVSARFQINILLSPVPDIGLLENVPRIFFPVIWFEHKATITEELAAQIKIVLQLPLIVQSFGIFVIVVGLIMIVTAISMSLCSSKRETHQDVKLTEGTIEPLLTDGDKAKISGAKTTAFTIES